MFPLSKKTAELLGTVTLLSENTLRRSDTVFPVMLALLNSQKAAENPLAFTVIVSLTVTPLILALLPFTVRFPLITDKDSSFVSQLPKSNKPAAVISRLAFIVN